MPGKLIKDKVDVVVSGINPNLNLGEDVYISGTVGAAMQGYFRGLPALAVSAPPPGNSTGLKVAARAAAALVKKIAADKSAGEVIGAIGVSGSTVENDHAVALAGANALRA